MWELQVLSTHKDKEEWICWTQGSFEDCLDDLFEWKSGTMGHHYVKAKLISPRKER